MSSMCSTNKIVYIGKLLLLFLFIGYYSGITLFYHGHIVNGHLIVHSHPFWHKGEKDANLPQHTHNSEAFFLIQQLNETNWDNSIDVPYLPDPVAIMHAPVASCEQNIFLSSRFSSASLRAPPIC